MDNTERTLAGRIQEGQATSQQLPSPSHPPGSPTVSSTPDFSLAPSIGQKPVSTGQKPVSTGQKPVSTGQKPVSTGQKPVSTGQKPVSTGQNGQKLVSTGQKPVSTGQKPVSTGQKPVSTGQKLVSTGQKPISTNKELAVSLDKEEPLVKRLRLSTSISPNREVSIHCGLTVDEAAPVSEVRSEGMADGSGSVVYRPVAPDHASRFSNTGGNLEWSELSLEDYATEDFEQRVQQIPRQWETTDLGVTTRQTDGEVATTQNSRRRPLTFTLMSYNILAQDLIDMNLDLYTRSSPEALNWWQRRRRLIAEIVYHNADILNLQEVQQDHYFNYLLPRLEKLGYSGSYQKRTGDKTDGCATLWKRDKFSLLQCTPVVYCRGGLLDRDNVALLIQLRPLRPGQQDSPPDPEDKIIIANTHLLFNPRRGDIKLAQLMVLLAEVDKHAYLGPPLQGQQQHSPTHAPWADHVGKERYCPVVMTGDFNMEPHCDLYKFLVCGTLKYEGLVAREMSGQQDSGWYGGTNYLSRHFLSPMYGLTDLSQYHSVVVERLQKSYQSFSKPSASHSCVEGGESDQNNSRQGEVQGKGSSVHRDCGNSQQDSEGVPKADGSVEGRVKSDTATADNRDSGPGGGKEDSRGSDSEDVGLGATEKSSDRKERSLNRNSDRTERSSDRYSDRRERSLDRNSDRRDRSSDRNSDRRERSLDRNSDRRDRSSDRNSDRRERSSDRKDEKKSSEQRQVSRSRDSNLPPLTPCSSGCLSHHLNLFSAYRHKVQRLGGNIDEVTTHHSRAECTVDYVFYSVDYKDVCVREDEEEGEVVEVRVVEEGHLKLLGHYGLMCGTELDELGGIPNTLLPSDHLCLVTKFLLQ
ncbi:hypothetical protein ACOMHN_064398 [Nucella lapillus]